MNKKGAWSGWGPSIAFAIILVALIFIFAYNDIDIFPSSGEFTKGYGSAEGFDTAFGSPAFKPLNYIFGYIPQILVDITGGKGIGTEGPTTEEASISAGLVIIALWTIMFLIFADIMNIFGPFSKPVNWAVAVLFAIIGANIKIVSYIAVYFLVIFSTFGSFAIMLSLFMPIILFVLFHFGGQKIRHWVIMRRAQDTALRAVAGSQKASGAIEGLGKIADSLKKISGP